MEVAGSSETQSMVGGVERVGNLFCPCASGVTASRIRSAVRVRFSISLLTGTLSFMRVAGGASSRKTRLTRSGSYKHANTTFLDAFSHYLSPQLCRFLSSGTIFVPGLVLYVAI